MKENQFNKQQMLAKVADFGADHAHLFPETTIARELIESIDQGVKEMYGQLGVQISSKGNRRSSRNLRISARQALESKLERIDQTARAMKLDQFYMPRAASLRALLATAESWIQEAIPLEQRFARQGLPAQFIDELKQAVQKLKDASREETRSRETGRAAVENYRKTLARTLENLDCFEALVMNQFQDDPAVLAKWEIVRKVTHAAVRRRRKGEPPPAEQGSGGIAQSETESAES